MFNMKEQARVPLSNATTTFAVKGLQKVNSKDPRDVVQLLMLVKDLIYYLTSNVRILLKISLIL